MGGDEEAVFSKKDRGRVGQKAVDKANAKGKRIKLSAQTADIRGGFILKNGDIEDNMTFPAVIADRRDELEDLIEFIKTGRKAD